MVTTRKKELIVKKIHYRTFRNGTILPIIEFNEKSFGEILSNFNFTETIRKGSRLSVKYIEDNYKEILEVKTIKYQTRRKEDIACPSCGSTKVASRIGEGKDGYKICMNRLCYTRPLSHLHLLGKVALRDKYNERVFNIFLKRFPLRDGSTSSIDNFKEFKHFFYEVNAKDTEPRESLWIKQFANEIVSGELLYKYELALDKYLLKNHKRRADFWAIANLDLYGLNTLAKAELFNIDPSELFGGVSVFIGLIESKSVAQVIEPNLTFLKELYDLLTIDGCSWS